MTQFQFNCHLEYPESMTVRQIKTTYMSNLKAFSYGATTTAIAIDIIIAGSLESAYGLLRGAHSFLGTGGGSLW